MSDADLFQSSGLNQQVVGQKSKGRLPGPLRALRQPQEAVMSDLQRMLADERKQHMDAYGYEHGNQ